MPETDYQPVPHDAAFRDALLAKPPEFDSWLQVVDLKEEKIATTSDSSQ